MMMVRGNMHARFNTNRVAMATKSGIQCYHHDEDDNHPTMMRTTDPSPDQAPNDVKGL